MDCKELIEQNTLLSNENARLIKEINRLNSMLGITQSALPENPMTKTITENAISGGESTDSATFSDVNNASDSISKINLFMSLFKGREDVYATRWENKKKQTSGYAPVCLNQWQAGLCGKPKTPCARCTHKSYAALDDHVIESHLRGNIVAGIYPMLIDETCWFLAMDFDEADWQNDISIVRSVCAELNISVAVERSRSGNGGHVWIFFTQPIPAAMARKFGTILLTISMSRRHEICFKSYDRLFPNQDTMPKGGFGNLIALPFQKAARQKNNSEFVDENFESYADQWALLSSIQKISEEMVAGLISEICPRHGLGQELGVLKIGDEEDTEKPWETRKVNLQKSEFPSQIEILKASMLFIPKAAISQRALNHLKRLSSFKNPMFYKQQAMRLSTYGHPRVISCADETREYLCLPRGCENDLLSELEQFGTGVREDTGMPY
ncbi:MAG: hypothetical protein C4518_04205 [Desulfobacteraceae bacterium]|nr:MAG: hypothetical protein C4518_04205 [Desulfobacteraceae bacterium]